MPAVIKISYSWESHNYLEMLKWISYNSWRAFKTLYSHSLTLLYRNVMLKKLRRRWLHMPLYRAKKIYQKPLRLLILCKFAHITYFPYCLTSDMSYVGFQHLKMSLLSFKESWSHSLMRYRYWERIFLTMLLKLPSDHHLILWRELRCRE